MHTVTVPIGNGWDNPLTSVLFGEMVKRAVPTVEAFHGDLFGDALSLDKVVSPLTTGQSARVWWVVRPHGTHLYGTESLALLVRDPGSTVYRIDVAERRPGRLDWVATFTTVRHVPARP